LRRKDRLPPFGSLDGGLSDGYLGQLIARRGADKFALHEAHLNKPLVKVLRTIGYDRNYVRGEGAHLWDAHGNKYLDLLSGWGTFGVGRNHPTVRSMLGEVLTLDLPNLPQMDVSVLSGLLAEELLATVPGDRLQRVFFANSGTEAVEAAIKFARCATKRQRIVFCDHAFHGLTYGALSLNGEAAFRDGFGPLLPDCDRVPFDDLAALERALAARDVAAFVVEPIQGKGVNLPGDGYLEGVAALCRKYGTLFIADEIQTGLGRTGRMWAIEHWGVEPDMLLTAKALSGGHIPVSAVLTRRDVFDAVFDRMDRAVVHGSTFAKNDMAMAAGLATLRVLREEKLVERAAAMGDRLMGALAGFVDRYEFVKEVRGKGLLIAIEFGRPKSLKLKTAWKMLEMANESLFSQMVLIPLFKEHRVLAQVAGHGINVVKLLPPLVIDENDCRWAVEALDAVVAECHRVPGSIWKLGRSLAGHALGQGR
jgi:ornithine--oxo-acid transaminase